jgi:hypothetical protein
MRRVLFLAIVGAAGCTDYGFTDFTVTDYFQQNRRNQLDLLVVIDNSCSMFEEQENLASNFGSLIDAFARAEVDWQIGVTTTDVEADRFRGLLVSGDDEIILRGPVGEIDRVEYDRKWPFAEGVALQLTRNNYRATSNMNLANWCPAPNSYVEQALGSPGQWNPGCDGAAIPVERADAADAGPRSPRSGNLIITEIMANARGPDRYCEWFELTNLTPDTLSLDGVTLTDFGNNFGQFPDGASVAPYGVTVVGRSTDPDLNCGVPVDYAFDHFVLMNHEPVLSPDTEDAGDLFNEMIAQGTRGSGIELGLEAARLVFMEPYYSEQNRSWLRDDASLAVLVVSDEDDVSPFNIDYYERFFLELKGDQAFREDGWFTFNAVVGLTPTDSKLDISCQSPNGVAYWGQRYIELARRRNGVLESICAEDFTPVVENLGLGISGLASRFTLSQRPVIDTLEVKLFEDSETESFVRDLVIDVDFTYHAEGNYLYFTEAQVPPPRYYVTAKYRPLATGSTNIVEDSN